VFSIDHHDGTANYSVLKNGEQKYWSSKHDPYDKELRKNQIDIRKGEVINFIDDLYSSSFVTTVLSFDNSVQIDLTKLVVGGHSFGGMTSIAVAHQDERVKAIFGLDPWLWVVVE
jgi:cephalosporin-C deacetylase-like acetyl esterase